MRVRCYWLGSKLVLAISSFNPIFSGPFREFFLCSSGVDAGNALQSARFCSLFVGHECGEAFCSVPCLIGFFVQFQVVYEGAREANCFQYAAN